MNSHHLRYYSHNITFTSLWSLLFSLSPLYEGYVCGSFPLKTSFAAIKLWQCWVVNKLVWHSIQNYSSRLAALDYTVCTHSEVFVTTQGGNFPHFLMGHRRYLYEGHAKTIKPDKKKLVLSFDNPHIRSYPCSTIFLSWGFCITIS